MWVGLCVVLCLGTLSYAQKPKKDPSVCDGCRFKNDKVGYNPHPYDCTQYVQCYPYEGGRIDPVYRNCEYGDFWNKDKLRCDKADRVDCPHDKCRTSNVQFYKHSDPNKCSAYWKCENGKAHGECCPEGQGFDAKQGCIPMPSCTDMCPYQDRVPGCIRRPISGAPTKYEQYADNGLWVKHNCPGIYAYNPADCECSVKLEHVCKPDLKINFANGIRDVSGNNVRVRARGVQIFGGAAYFRGRRSMLTVDPFRPKAGDDGTFIVKLRYREDLRRRRMWGHQAMVTNGHCGRHASMVVTKIPGKVFVGAETANMTKYYSLPTVNKQWKEVIYIKDGTSLETRVCGASEKRWSVGHLKDTGCGLRFGNTPGLRGFYGLIDDIEVYRCKPLDAVINVNY